MTISFKVWAGLAVAALGLSGLVYSMQIFSDATASHVLVYREANVPAFPDNMKAYLAIELASAGMLTVGIVIMALGHYDTFAMGADTRSTKDTKPMSDSKSKVAGEAWAELFLALPLPMLLTPL